MCPIYLSSTFELTGIGTDKGWDYSRAGNPTRDRLEEALAALEGGTSGHAFASGMAAIYALVAHAAHRRPRHLLAQCLWRHGAPVQPDHPALRHRDRVCRYSRTWTPLKRRSRPNTKLVHVETPTNPLMALTDIAAVCGDCACHGRRSQRR